MGGSRTAQGKEKVGKITQGISVWPYTEKRCRPKPYGCPDWAHTAQDGLDREDGDVDLSF